MVVSCLVNGCKTDPTTQLPVTVMASTTNSTLRKTLDLPTTIKAYHRICSDCMKKVPSQRRKLNRCASTVAVTMDTAFRRHH